MRKGTIPQLTSFNTLSVPRNEVAGILADYLALERTRVVRRLLVVRFGALTLIAVVVGFLIHGLSIFARWVPVGLFATPPVWAWIVELRLALRLSGRLAGVEDRKS
jgi:hypothetical protein